MNNQPQEYYTPIQLKFPIEIEKIIEISDPVYTLVNSQSKFHSGIYFENLLNIRNLC